MQIMRDAELLKLVIECEEMDYQSKRTYDTDARPDWDRWVREAEEGWAEEAIMYGHEQAIAPMLVCFRRFLVPFRKMAAIRREDFPEQEVFGEPEEMDTPDVVIQNLPPAPKAKGRKTPNKKDDKGSELF
jgi:hypothetical protein